MEFSVNFGIWSSVFAVPKQIVNNYIKLAGATQLKVILWILGNADEKISLSDISKAIGKSEDDVIDAIQFWVELGVINIDNNVILSGEIKKQNIQENVYTKDKLIEINQVVETELQDKKQRIATRTVMPDTTYVTERINSSEEISFLMQEAQVIFGRPLSMNDSAKLLMMHENDGLPVEVIIMILQYAVKNGKGMRYIEKMGISWSEEEICTIEMAEEKIKKLENNKKYAYMIQRLFGLSNHIPSEKEEEYSTRWLSEYKFSEDIIKYAYDICINRFGEYKINYINGILNRWFKKGIKSIDEAKAEQEENSSKLQEQNKPSFDIEEFEREYDLLWELRD